MVVVLCTACTELISLLHSYSFGPDSPLRDQITQVNRHQAGDLLTFWVSVSSEGGGLGSVGVCVKGGLLSQGACSNLSLVDLSAFVS